MNMPQIALHGLPKRLVDDQLIAATVLEEATVSAKTSKISLVQYLCDKHLLSSEQIGKSAAKEFGIPLYALEKHNPDSFPKRSGRYQTSKKTSGYSVDAARQSTLCGDCRPDQSARDYRDTVSNRYCRRAGAGSLFSDQ